MKSVVVTGASTGIGQATVEVLAARGFHVFGSVRRPKDGEMLKAAFADAFTPLCFDVTDPAAIARGAETVAAALNGETLAGLVNNAGIALPGALMLLPPEELERQLRVNVVGVHRVTTAFAPLLGARLRDGDKPRTGRPGRIVMMSSVGGTSATPFMGAYNASKFALEGLSEALRREMMLFGIDVIVIAPGQVKTPIWAKGEAMDRSAYDGTVYAPALTQMLKWLDYGNTSGLDAAVIGKGVFTALTAARPRTRYVLTPAPLQHFIVNHLPKRMVDRLICKRLGLMPASRK